MNKRITRKKYKKMSSKYLKQRRKIKTNKNHKQYLFGGSNQNRNNFKNMFIKNLRKLKDAIQNNDLTKINETIITFSNGFRSNHLGINYRFFAYMNNFELIDREISSTITLPNVAIYPCLVIIFGNISDNNIRKQLINSFIQNGGNINLQSSKTNMSALSYAVESRDRDLILFLQNNGADPNTLNEEQRTIYDDIMMQIRLEEEEKKRLKLEAKRRKKAIRHEVTEQAIPTDAPLPTVISTVISKVPEIVPDSEQVIKLIIPTPLPSEMGYPLDLEPDFWLPLFGYGNMFTLREKIHSMMIEDARISVRDSKWTQIWGICQIIQTLIPTYYVPTEFKPSIPTASHTGLLVVESPIDTSNYNILLCAALLVFGIISKKMEKQDYHIIFKGGKAIQLVLGQIKASEIYKSEDIDVLVMPNDIVYNEEHVKNLSGHIGYLVRWFLNITIPQPLPQRPNIIDISVLRPNPSNPRSNPFIFKLSYKKQFGGFQAISDIDFKEIPENIKSFFEKSVNYQFVISELDEKVTFTCPNIVALLEEKLYYYSLYTYFRDLLSKGQSITKPGYEALTIDECNRLLDKFKRAILPLNKGIQTQRSRSSETDLRKKEINFLLRRLETIGVDNKDIQQLVMNQLYSEDTI